MGAKTKTRRHLSVEAWREVFGRFDASGESVTGFCKREGLHTSSFNRWRQRLSGQPTVQARTPGKASRQATEASCSIARWTGRRSS